MAKKNITKNDEKKASRAVVDTKSLDGSTRSGGIDRSGAALPLAYRKLNTALELTFSLADDPHFVDIKLCRLKTGMLTRSHYILTSDLQQWIGVFEAEGWQPYGKKVVKPKEVTEPVKDESIKTKSNGQ